MLWKPKGTVGCGWKGGCWIEGTGGRWSRRSRLWTNGHVGGWPLWWTGVPCTWDWVSGNIAGSAIPKRSKHTSLRQGGHRLSKEVCLSGQQNGRGNSQTAFVSSSGPLVSMVRAAVPGSFPWNVWVPGTVVMVWVLFSAYVSKASFLIISVILL